MQATEQTLQRLAAMSDELADSPVFLGNLTRAQYDSLSGINASVLKQPTTLEMLAAMERQDDRLSYPLQFGSLVHLAILEPNFFESSARASRVVTVSTATLRTKEAKAAFEANPGAILATEAMIAKAQYAKEAAWRHKQFARLMTSRPVATETAFQVWDDTFGLWRKGLLDVCPTTPAGWVLDVKTTSKPLNDLNVLDRETKTLGYDFSAAYYADLVHMAHSAYQVENFLVLWLNGPSAEGADQNEPWLARLHVIPRFPNDALPFSPSLTGQLETIARKLSWFRDAMRANSWEAYDDETLEGVEA